MSSEDLEDLEKLEDFEEFTFCRRNSCCPKLKRLSKDEFILEDDYGGSVRLSLEEIIIFVNDLPEKYSIFKESI